MGTRKTERIILEDGIVDPTDATKEVAWDIAGAITSTSTTLDFNQTIDQNIDFPDASGTVALEDSSAQTLLPLLFFDPYPEMTADVSTLTGLAGTNKWVGGVLAGNGKIYCIPGRESAVLIIDPLTNTLDTTTISGFLSTGSFKWVGAVLGPNGKIYGIPNFNTSVLIIDPSTDTADTSTISGLAGIEKWYGGVLVPDSGKIYCSPDESLSLLIIDTNTDTIDTSTISGLGTGAKWNTGVMAPNGKLYFLPTYKIISSPPPTVLIVDPVTNTVDTTTITFNSGGSTTWLGATVSPVNGKIYAPPSDNNSNSVLIIDPTTDTIDTSTIHVPSSGVYFVGGILAPDNKIYAIPSDATNILIIDPATDTADSSTISGLAGTNKFRGGVLAPNGKIYGVPFNSTSVLIIGTDTQSIDIIPIMGASVNKL